MECASGGSDYSVECANCGNDYLVECVSGGNDCLVECASGGSDYSMECPSGMRYSMCGGTPWAMCVECGMKQGPNCKRTEKNSRCWKCLGGMGMGHCVATSFGTRNPNVCKVVVGSC